MKWNWFRISVVTATCVIGVTLLAALGVAGSYVFLAPSLPSSADMRNVELAVPLRVYTRGGQLVAQIGEQRRIPVTYEQIPATVREAFLAAEDDRFFRHHGIDYAGVLRAAAVNLFTGNRAQGASTITMQVARNMFLTQKREWRRKLQEVFLTWRMEREFTKEQILALYLNVIFFGQRSYGVAAAAETYFGKPLERLTVGEAALLAGIPKAPTDMNPIASPQRARDRRSYVLRRMHELGYISDAELADASAEPVVGKLNAPLNDVDAPYVAEMARLELVRRYGEAAQSAGFRVFTTIDPRLQAAANRALRLGLLEYDRRRGWRGATARVTVPAGADAAALDTLLVPYEAVGNVDPAVVTAIDERSARVHVKGLGSVTIPWDGLAWARRVTGEDARGPAPKKAGDVVTPGDVVFVVTDGKRAAQLVQVPEAQGALVALDPDDGAIAALIGGFDYYVYKYNRATQASRQPGSGFKPFLYSAALENGFTPASVILDAPIVMDDPDSETSWRPENSSGEFHGPTRLREALVRSRNLVSIRILRDIGTRTLIDYAARFGFARASMPNDLTLALGTLQATPLEVATGFAAFANGGYRIEPYFIDRIEDASGKIVYEAAPRGVCEQCGVPATSTGAPELDAPLALQAAASVRGGLALPPKDRIAERIISPQNAYIMDDIMADVIRRGTGRRANVLNRSDIAGKTGTTNDSKDAWFNGFNRDLVATVWVGYDQERSLGEGEEGSRTAVPIWVYFMREALKALPQHVRPRPEGVIELPISRETGLLATADDPDAVSELFMADHLPGGGNALQPGAVHSPDQAAGSEPIF
ncbi:MAG TPA: penicillin-binding protein 1A [Steroidobacteraceae bacterium]|nr:penicillin-binding protein 1A [Steroidobacteraceae bacterium]